MNKSVAVEITRDIWQSSPPVDGGAQRGGEPIPAAASTDVLNSLYSLGRVEEEKRTRLYIFSHRYNLVLFLLIYIRWRRRRRRRFIWFFFFRFSFLFRPPVVLVVVSFEILSLCYPFFPPPLHAQLVWCDVTGIRHPATEFVDTHTAPAQTGAERLLRFVILSCRRRRRRLFFDGALLFPRVYVGVPAAPITCAVGNVLMCVLRRLYLDNISESKMGETTGSKRHTRLTLNGEKKMMIIIINSSSELVISRD